MAARAGRGDQARCAQRARRQLDREHRVVAHRRPAGGGAARVRALLPAGEPRRAASPAATQARGRARRRRRPRVARGCVPAARSGSGDGARRPRGDDLDSARAHRAPHRGDQANRPARAHQDRRPAHPPRRSAPGSRRAGPDRGAPRRGSDAALADGRGQARPPADHRRDSQRTVVLRAQPDLRRHRSAARLAPARAGIASSADVRLVDRRRHGRQPCCRAGLDRRGPRRGAQGGSTPLSRRGARARGRDRIDAVARSHLPGARAVALA